MAKYYYYPGWQEPGPNLEFTINQAAWEELPKDLQAMLRTAAEAVNNDVLAEYTARNNQALKELTEKHGVDVRRLPDDVLDAPPSACATARAAAGEAGAAARVSIDAAVWDAAEMPELPELTLSA